MYARQCAQHKPAKSGLASLPSEGRAGLAGGSIGQSALFWFLSRLPARQVWASKKVTGGTSKPMLDKASNAKNTKQLELSTKK